MRVAAVDEGRLRIVERDDPQAAGTWIRVRLLASGVNRADLLQRAGRYPAPRGQIPDDVPGLEFCGRVDQVGDGVTRWEIGDRVMGLAGGGAHADLLVVPEDAVVAVPDQMDDTVAGAVPEVFVTAHDALVTQAGLRSGETVLIHAVGSGVGTAAVQLVTALGARALGTTRTPAKLDRARELGLDGGVVVGDPADRAVADAIREFGEPDVVLNLVGGDYAALDLAVTAPKGRIVVVGLLAGAKVEANLGYLLSKRLELRGTVLRARPDHEKAAAMDAFGRQVVPLLESGRIAPVIDEVMPFEEADGAYDLVASDETFGKVVLSW